MILKEMKDWIDQSSYEDLLRRYRLAPIGDPIFQEEVGKYYEEIMSKKKKEVGDVVAIQASKNIGWRA